MKSAAKRKWGEQRGETIAETLVGLLISVLGMVMLAGAITTTARIVEKSRKKMGEYYQVNEVMVKMPATLEGDSLVSVSSGILNFTDTTSDPEGNAATDRLLIQDQQITYYQTNLFNRETPVTIYKLGGATGN